MEYISLKIAFAIIRRSIIHNGEGMSVLSHIDFMLALSQAVSTVSADKYFTWVIGAKSISCVSWLIVSSISLSLHCIILMR